jgi:HPt (histidine-containing phosphotransfer) domain-containing protein
MERGFNDYLSKPIDTIKLNAILEKWVPKAKHKKPLAVRNGTANADKEVLQIEIEGVDTQKGIVFSGGMLDYYIEILSTFHEDGTDRINGLKECIETKNLELYTTYVHALKSASGGIGASAISKAAAELEELGDKGDLEAVKVLNPRFIADFELLLDRVSKALAAYASNGNGNGNGTASESSEETDDSAETEAFMNALASLKNALGTMSPGAINQAAEQLQKCSNNENAAVIRTIVGKITMVDYDEAEELIDGLLSIVN